MKQNERARDNIRPPLRHAQGLFFIYAPPLPYDSYKKSIIVHNLRDCQFFPSDGSILIGVVRPGEGVFGHAERQRFEASVDVENGLRRLSI